MNKTIKLLIVLVVMLIVAFQFFFIVQEGEQAVVTQFGKIERTEREAGLKFKIPVIDTVTTYSKRILAWDGDPQRIPTSENQFIWVDTTARWVISDPALFYESVTSINQAYSRLDDVINSAVRSVVSQNPLSESVRSSNLILENKTTTVTESGEGPSFSETSTNVFDSINNGRQELASQMLKAAGKDTLGYGIELEDIVVRQIRYSDDLTQSVYNRMIKERNQIAQAYRSYGEGEKAEWMGKLEREKKSVLSGAFATSEETKGNADAEAAAIYAEAYGEDPEFYRFWKSLESYKKSLPEINKVLSTDMEYFNYLYSVD